VYGVAASAVVGGYCGVAGERPFGAAEQNPLQLPFGDEKLAPMTTGTPPESWAQGLIFGPMTRDAARTIADTWKYPEPYHFYDATADDARLVLAVLRTAALGHGAVIANRAPAVGIAKDANGRLRCA